VKNLASHVPFLAVLACMAACGSNGSEDTAPETVDLVSAKCELTIDASQTEFDIPATYVGVALDRKYISGEAGAARLFDPSFPQHDELVNLLREIGVKHIRVLSDGARELPECTSWVVDPTPQQDADFFEAAANAGLGDQSITYSLHLFNEEQPSPTSDNVSAVEHLLAATYRPMIESFAFDNEPDWHWLYASHGPCFDPNVAAYLKAAGSTGYRDAWRDRQAAVVAAMKAAGGPPVPFSGPDTGSAFPVQGDEDTSIGGVPYTLRFAKDHEIDLATQHYYGATSTIADSWVKRANYVAGDVVADTQNHGVTYRCKENDPGSSVAPHASGRWDIYPPLWQKGASYARGDAVQDPTDLPDVYTAVLAEASSAAAPKGSTDWALDTAFGYPSARQMAMQMLDPQRPQDWQVLLDGALAKAPGWPQATGGLPLAYRFTEANAYSGGQDPASHSLAMALWSLDFFHWWAARGAKGVDPFTRLVQYNAPIFQDPTTQDLSAAPYAYGMRAFAEGSSGHTVNPSAVRFSVTQDRITAYAVVSSSHLYVTIVNKTFHSVGGIDETITLRLAHFAPTSARALVLESGDGDLADAVSSSVALGGATIPSAGTFAGVWNPMMVASDGSVELTVRAASAVVLDLTP
jgi:hypothetical protein